MKRFLGSVTLTALAAFALVAAGEAGAVPGSGDEWEVTSQMTMEGMPAGMGMGAQTRKTCTAKEWTKPPVANDDRNCKTTNFNRTATGASWTMDCEGMSGTGEITRTGPDAFKGSIKMSAPQGAMTINLSGRRIGECDAGEAKKERDAQMARIEGQIAAGQAASNDAIKKMCSMGADGLDPRTWRMYESTCTGPEGGLTAAAYKAPLCEKAKTYEGYKILVDRRDDPENDLAAVAKFCGLDPGAMTTAACAQAVKTNDYMLIGKKCPNEAQKIAKEHCAGRSYTSAGTDAYSQFCVTYAKDMLK